MMRRRERLGLYLGSSDFKFRTRLETLNRRPWYGVPRPAGGAPDRRKAGLCKGPGSCGARTSDVLGP
jgi:hypothetical protein